MKIVGMFKTKTHLPELIKEVEAGEELCITNHSTPHFYPVTRTM
ncbi:Type II toxin-antitoxin system Phd/YefM family antitoxin N-terminal domain protein [Candidatus Trichorickettsia mobilis]|uniref:Type II toxin-antitoxin system Phd/YefM family antitoxin N-terminal domain protein n=1 Tax=Candidatus Trichorickettsia mobilis TaxID=1346319 RepID=A0ABZ0UTC5_9RICK|nr:type II toxin-antitoxin system prevent-host-death family antitoxin [Candidatus Trichorickettsia mobilis]WPY01293.1 Type II toxin-antitoxin system Phd/YefM family antitoxin N-terminal domain protein [Candidatus Trichorickettsia mobilis]